MIDESGLTRYAIAQQAKINQAKISESTLSRIYAGKGPATMETLVAVANTLGRRVIVRIE